MYCKISKSMYIYIYCMLIYILGLIHTGFIHVQDQLVDISTSKPIPVSICNKKNFKIKFKIK